MTDPTWVVGSGGLLGRAVVAELRARHVPVATSRVPWQQPQAATEVLVSELRGFLAARAGRPWRIAWCAGAGVVGTTRAELDCETEVLARVAAEIRGAGAGNGTIFLASSAGGVYAGATGAPHTELTPVAPLADYGRAKLVTEQLLLDVGRRTGCAVVVGRLSNLYGPGQNLAKPQGLISQLCRGFLAAQPVSVYVSLDTIRDYLYVGDAAAMVADLLAVAPGTGSAVKILSSGRGTTIAAVLAACRSVFRRTPRVVLASSELVRVQARDLRFRSVVWPEVDRHARTTLLAGIGATLDSTRRVVNG